MLGCLEVGVMRQVRVDLPVPDCLNVMFGCWDVPSWMGRTPPAAAGGMRQMCASSPLIKIPGAGDSRQAQTSSCVLQRAACARWCLCRAQAAAQLLTLVLCKAGKPMRTEDPNCLRAARKLATGGCYMGACRASCPAPHPPSLPLSALLPSAAPAAAGLLPALPARAD